MTMHIEPTDDLDACLAIRRIVFINEQKVPEHDELDNTDAGCVQFLATDQGGAIGTARLKPDGTIGKIGRVCVLRQHRGKGLGAALIQAAIDHARELGLAQVRLGAQVQALGFYENLGFRATGPVYDDAGIDHRDMIRAV